MKSYPIKWFILLLSIFLDIAPFVSAELYKWVDANGVVHFSDQPHKEDPNNIPIETRPSIKSKVSIRKAPNPDTPPSPPVSIPSHANVPAASTSPPAYDSAEVELFVTQRCRYCTMARNYLNAKGIAFTEYDVNKDSAALQRKRRLDPRRGVPLAVINGQTILGFSPAAYEAALAASP